MRTTRRIGFAGFAAASLLAGALLAAVPASGQRAAQHAFSCQSCHKSPPVPRGYPCPCAHEDHHRHIGFPAGDFRGFPGGAGGGLGGFGGGGFGGGFPAGTRRFGEPAGSGAVSPPDPRFRRGFQSGPSGNGNGFGGVTPASPNHHPAVAPRR